MRDKFTPEMVPGDAPYTAVTADDLLLQLGMEEESHEEQSRAVATWLRLYSAEDLGPVLMASLKRADLLGGEPYEDLLPKEE